MVHESHDLSTRPRRTLQPHRAAVGCFSPGQKLHSATANMWIQFSWWVTTARGWWTKQAAVWHQPAENHCSVLTRAVTSFHISSPGGRERRDSGRLQFSFDYFSLNDEFNPWETVTDFILAVNHFEFPCIRPVCCKSTCLAYIITKNKGKDCLSSIDQSGASRKNRL